jgi:hypothetical protein
MVLPAALLSGILYYRLIDMPNLEARMVLHQQICLGEADSPYRYRILVPYAIEIVLYLVSRWVIYKVAFQVAYCLYDIFSLCLFFWCALLLASTMAFTNPITVRGFICLCHHSRCLLASLFSTMEFARSSLIYYKLVSGCKE